MIRITPLIATVFRSDGGTMFGLVPKAIWARKMPPDERNRIPQHAHSLLVELPDGRRALVDTGCGPATNFSEKEIDVHALGPGWPLMENLDRLGVTPAQIDLVLCTHLHWDHAGGVPAPGGGPAFPNATLCVHELEWRDAMSRDPLLFKSYPEDLMAKLREVPFRHVSDDAPEIAPGLQLVRSSGHTRGHCAAVFRDDLELVLPGGARRASFAVFAGDVCPMRMSLRMVYQTSYDTYPLETRAWKRTWLPKLVRKEGVLLFDHDPDLFGATIQEDPREEFAVVESFAVSPASRA
jgi:glyoxylase-like metal-dependent hydrolase (beta-lactamase superfamily II)